MMKKDVNEKGLEGLRKAQKGWRLKDSGVIWRAGRGEAGTFNT
jgi:hypothetical protein